MKMTMLHRCIIMQLIECHRLNQSIYFCSGGKDLGKQINRNFYSAFQWIGLVKYQIRRCRTLTHEHSMDLVCVEVGLGFLRLLGLQGRLLRFPGDDTHRRDLGFLGEVVQLDFVSSNPIRKE